MLTDAPTGRKPAAVWSRAHRDSLKTHNSQITGKDKLYNLKKQYAFVDTFPFL